MDVSPSGSGTVEVNNSIPSSYPLSVSAFSNGMSVQLKAITAHGYVFDGWAGDVADPHSATTIVIMDSAKAVFAKFSQIIPTLGIRVNGRGSTTPLVGDHSYVEGTKVSIAAVPDTGWRFDGWAGDVADPNSATTIVIMDSAKTVAANFSQVIHTLGISINGRGSTTPLVGDHSYGEGTRVSIAGVPEYPAGGLMAGLVT